MSKVSLVLAVVCWSLVVVGISHSQQYADQIPDQTAIMTRSTYLLLFYTSWAWAFALVSFVLTILDFALHGRSKLRFLNLALSGLMAIPIALLLIRQAFL